MEAVTVEVIWAVTVGDGGCNRRGDLGCNRM